MHVLYACHICSKSLSTKQRLMTHLQTHGNNTEQYDLESNESVNSDSDSNHSCAHDSFKDESSRMDDDDSCNDESSHIDDDDDDNVSNESVTDEQVWDRVMSQIFDGNTREDFMNDDCTEYSMKKIRKKTRDYVEDLVQLADDIRQTDVYENLCNEKQRLENKGYEEDEAEIMAWKNRKYMIIKRVILPFIEDAIDQPENDDE